MLRSRTTHFLVLILLSLVLAGGTVGWKFRNDDYPILRRVEDHAQSFGITRALVTTQKDYHETAYSWNKYPLRTDYWRPGVEITFALDHLLYGIWSGGYHLTNILIHFGTAWGVYLCTMLLYRRTGAAFLSGVLFLCS